ncbi:hypothetical protein ACMA5I_10340 [Paracoccaceae bacterium GXU_MW_L88]
MTKEERDQYLKGLSQAQIDALKALFSDLGDAPHEGVDYRDIGAFYVARAKIERKLKTHFKYISNLLTDEGE